MRVLPLPIISFLLFITFLTSCASKKKSSSNMEINGTILLTESYCGGARPSDELVKSLRTPHPLVNHEFYIKAGTQNQIDSPIVHRIKTDQEGKFQIVLQEGSYILLHPDQLDQKIISSPGKDIVITNEDELKKWWHIGLANINSQNTEINLIFHKRCNLPLGIPHLRYTGPAVP